MKHSLLILLSICFFGCKEKAPVAKGKTAEMHKRAKRRDGKPMGYMVSSEGDTARVANCGCDDNPIFPVDCDAMAKDTNYIVYTQSY
jgi:hypothetical protein